MTERPPRVLVGHLDDDDDVDVHDDGGPYDHEYWWATWICFVKYC